jgi:hypothetical protein
VIRSGVVTEMIHVTAVTLAVQQTQIRNYLNRALSVE